MITNVSAWGVLVAALVAMIIGSIWYSKPVFGKAWMKGIGLTDAEMKKNANVALVSLALISLVTAYVLALFMYYYHLHTGGNWFLTGFYVPVVIWIGFGATTLLAHGVFEPKRENVLLINAGNRLVTLVGMGMVIAAFMTLATK